VPNLNPSQLRQRPVSASLRTPRSARADDPSFARLRNEGQATPRVAPKPEVPPGEEEPWLFSFPRSLSTMDVWKMGFSRVVIFGAHHWASEEVCAAELSEAFRANTPIPSLANEYRESLEAMIAPAFLKGDVLLAVQFTAAAAMPPEERARCVSCAAKLIDAVSNVWSQYDEMNETELGAVVVVLEGYSEATLHVDWGGGDEMDYPVTTLDDGFTVFFK